MKKAFTLIELVVVITILGVLSIFGFISYSWYATSARDTSRVTDLKSIAKTLEYFAIEHDSYPLPSESTAITFSWTVVWNQGIIWQSVLEQVRRLATIPFDPLTGTEYAYSVSADLSRYQLWSVSETGDITLLHQKAIAAGSDKKAIIVGNYYSPLQDLRIGNEIYILALPSILNSSHIIHTLKDIIAQNTLVISGKQNLPANYRGSDFVSNVPDQNILNPDHLVVYNGEVGKELSFPEKKEIIENLQKAYLWTLTQSSDVIEIDELMKIDMNNDTEIQRYFWNISLIETWNK